MEIRDDRRPLPDEPGAPWPAGGATPVAGELVPDARLQLDPKAHRGLFHFPPGFLWGAATSSHQVEGHNTNNDWWAWEEQGRVPWRSGEACDHYHRFREDFDLARDLRHNAHRFSLEWSRIEPEDGRFSEAAIAHYGEVIDALRERGMEPVLTVNHYTLPRWLAEQGGWERPDIEERFLRYVERVADAYASRVRWWITLNEPVVQVFKGWVIGQWPPGQQNLPHAFQVVRHMLRAHVRAYHAIHARRPDAMVSVAHHALALAPCNPHRVLDRLSVQWRDFLFNQMFLEALLTGRLAVPGQFFERLPSGRTLDFIGVNYYTRDFVHNAGFDVVGMIGTACGRDHSDRVDKRTALGWEVYPEGLLGFLRSYTRFKLPSLITENGIATSHEEDRFMFLTLHLWQLARGIGLGIPVLGYLHWSLLDNFEWADGFTDARFGLIAVDFKTQRRMVRFSARRYADIIENNHL